MTEYLTTKEVAAVLRLKERKVYDLAAKGALPCSRATGKLLFPRAEIEAWLTANVKGMAVPAAAKARPPVLLGSSDPLLEWALRESACGLATFLDGSLNGLQRFRNGDGIGFGLHVWDGQADTWNVQVVSEQLGSEPAVLIEWAWRQRGVIVAPGSAAQFSAGLAGLAGKRLAPRQVGSGSQVLLEALLQRDEIDSAEIVFSSPARTESDAALMVLEGKVDAAFGLAALAVQYRLDFVPVINERFDLVIDRRAYFGDEFQALLGFCRTPKFVARASELTGYDIAGFGCVHFNGS